MMQLHTVKKICSQLVPFPQKPKRSCCVHLPPDIVKDPDPSIYNPELEYASGRFPTFNSPDISTMNVWPITPSDALQVNFRNLSYDASANSTQIDLSWSPWGIGFPRQPIVSVFRNLARAGFPGSQQSFTVTSPKEVIDARRYGIFVELKHPYDRDRSNNHGEQIVDGFQTSQGRRGQFVIPVKNPKYTTEIIQLSVNPNIWGASIVPASLTLGPMAQQDTQFSVEVPPAIPASPAGTVITQTFDILATISGTFLGGVSIIVLVD